MNSKHKVFKRGVSIALAVATSLSLSAGALVMPLAASADATSDLIASLQAQIMALQAQLNSLSGPSMSMSKCTWTRSLTVGMKGDDVTCLQGVLKSGGYLSVSPTGYFGPLTKAAVAAWQAASGVSPAAGYWGPLSQAKYNSMAMSTPSPVPPGTPPPPVAIGRGLTVSSGVQPPESLAPNSAARVPFTRAVFTASADGDVWVNSVTAERQGFGTDAALSEVLLLDEDGIQVGLGKTLNSNHQAILNEPFVVKAGTSRSMTLAASRPASDTVLVAGQVIRLALVGVDAGSSVVSGSLPIAGNAMTMNNSLTIGTVTNQTGPRKSVASTTEDIGKKDFIFAAIRVTAGSAEKVRVNSIRWNQVGTAGVSDVANLKTYVEDTAYPVMVSSDGKYYTAKFGSGVVLDKGANAEIYIKGDIVGGANRTLKFDIYRTTDLNVTGETYGYGITPPTSGSGFTSTNPWYFASQVTIGKGSLNVENATSVSSQNVAINLANQPLGGFSVEVKGEAISVAQMVFNLGLSNGVAGTQVTQVSIYDASGKVVAGPVDGVAAKTLTFSDTVTFPVGKNVFTLKGKLGTSFSNNTTVQASTTPSSDWTTVRGQTTGETISATPTSAVALSTFTAKTAAMTLSVSNSPVAQTVVAGGSQFTFANYQFDSTASGEDLRMNSIPLAYETHAGATATNLTSCQLYDGNTSITTGSNIINPSAAASSTTFTFDGSGLTISKGAIKTLALKCNIASGASGAYSWGYDDGQSPSATGMVSGQSATITENDSSGQKMTLTSTGSLAVALDSSAPAYGLGAAGSTDNTVSVLRFTATNEAIDLSRVALQLGASASNSPSDLVKVSLWDGATKVGEAIFTGTSDWATSTLTTPVRIGKDENKLLTVKADYSAEGVSEVGTPGALVAVEWDNDDSTGTQGLGVNSGTTINRTSSGDTSSTGVRVYKSYPTLAVIPLSDTKLVSGRRDLMKFSITANPKGDVGVYKVTFRIATSSATALVDMIDGVNVYAFTDSGYSTPVSGVQTDGSLLPVNVDLSTPKNAAAWSVSWASSATDIEVFAMTAANASTTVVVPAGQTRYFVIRGDVTTTGATFSASTQLQGDSRHAPVPNAGLNSTYLQLAATIHNGAGSATGDNNFIWRPFSTTTTQSAVANDYTSGYGMPGLPNTNTSAQILTQ